MYMHINRFRLERETILAKYGEFRLKIMKQDGKIMPFLLGSNHINIQIFTAYI